MEVGEEHGGRSVLVGLDTYVDAIKLLGGLVSFGVLTHRLTLEDSMVIKSVLVS